MRSAAIGRLVPALGLAFAIGSVSLPAAAALLIGNSTTNSIVRFDETTGTFLGDFVAAGTGGLAGPASMVFGPDGNLYVASGGSSSLNVQDPTYPQDSAVLRFSATGQFLGTAAAGGGLARPTGLAFGPDGALWVSSFRTNQILRYDATTGALLGVFASDGNGGLGSANGLNGPNGLLFGPDGSLFVTTQGSANDSTGDLVFPFESQVLRYTPQQVAAASATTPTVFVAQPAVLPDSFGFVSLQGLALAPDGQSLYVSDFAGGVRRHDLVTGALLETRSANYTGTTPSNNFLGDITFGTGSSANTLFGVGFDFVNANIGSVLAFTGGLGAETFTGIAYTDASLRRSIGIVAMPPSQVPAPATLALFVTALAGLVAVRAAHDRPTSPGQLRRA